MLFENDIPFLILKVLITFAGTFGMMISTAKLNFVKKKPVSILILAGYALYAVLSTCAIIYFLDYEHFLRVFLFTISFPAVVLLHRISDEPFPRLVFTRATHILVSLYIAATVTLLNTALHGTRLSDILLRLLAYLLVIVLDFHFVRRIYLDFVSAIPADWGILALIPCALTVLAVVFALYPAHYTKNPTGIALIYLLGAAIIILYLAFARYLILQYNRLSAESNREILEMQAQNLKKEAARTEELAEQAKIIRHDTRHILSTVASLAESGDMQAILDFVNTTIGEIPETEKGETYDDF